MGNLNDCFDGNLNTLVRSANVNPAWVEVEFPERIEVYKVKVSLGKPDIMILYMTGGWNRQIRE
jgi:hypothetical protein